MFSTAKVYSEMRSHQQAQKKMSDAELGLSELAKAAQNPKAMAEAMEMLKDPETAAEVLCTTMLLFIHCAIGIKQQADISWFGIGQKNDERSCFSSRDEENNGQP